MPTGDTETQPNGPRTQRRRTRRVDPELLAKINELGESGAAATKIHGLLKRIPRWEPVLPSVRTIQNILSDRPKDPTGPWSLNASSREEAALVIPVLAAVIEKTAGHRRVLTVAEADCVIRVRTVAPDLPLYAAYQLAGFYRVRQAKGLRTHDVDALLAFAPWRGPVAWQRYKAAADVGWVSRPYLSWLFSSDYRDMLKRMGFSDMEIDAARDYQHLLAIRERLETTGTSQVQEDNDGD